MGQAMSSITILLFCCSAYSVLVLATELQTYLFYEELSVLCFLVVGQPMPV